jgi:hypothetical protein
MFIVSIFILDPEGCIYPESGFPVIEKKDIGARLWSINVPK